MAQVVTALVAKPDDPSLISAVHTVKEPSCPLIPTHAPKYMHIHTYIHTNK